MDFQEPDWMNNYHERAAEIRENGIKQHLLRRTIIHADRSKCPNPNSKNRFDLTKDQQMRHAYRNQRLYPYAEDLWLACVSYFEWAEDNPLIEAKHYIGPNGKAALAEIPKARVFSIAGLCLHLGIRASHWTQWCDPYHKNYKADYQDVIETVHGIIYTQKYEHGMSGLFNTNMIMRDLGMVDKQSIESSQQSHVSITDMSQVFNDTAALYHPDDEFCDEKSILYTQSQLDAGAPLVRKP